MNRFARVVVLVAVVPAAVACTGSPSSTSGWVDTTDKTIGQAQSSLGTVRVVLEAETHHHVTRSYALGALSDAVEVADKEIAKYDGVQPPDALHPLSAAVVAELHDAARLLVEVRTTYSSPDASNAEISRLLSEVEAGSDRLDRLTTKVDRAAP